MSKKINILLIEDDLVDQKIFARVLLESTLRYNLQIMDEADGMLSEGGVKNLASFDIIYLDYKFPTGVSSTMVHLLKKHWEFKTPVVLLTGTDSEILKSNIESYDNVYYRMKCEETYREIPSFISKLFMESSGVSSS